MRILIAEDEPKTQRYLQQGLRELGFAVEVVGDGNAALTLLREHCFDAPSWTSCFRATTAGAS